MTRVAVLVVAALVALAAVPAGVSGVATAPASADGATQATGVQLQENDTSSPTADASVPSPVTVGERVVLDGSGSTGSDLSYRWEFGNGGAWDGEKTTHRFARPGQETVTLTVTDDAGRTDTETVTVDVQEPDDGNGLDADLSLSKQEVAVGETFVMDASGTTAGSEIVGYWYSDDDDMQHEQKNEGDSIATCIDDGPGDYTLHVWAVEEGSVDRASATIEVTGSGPTDGCTGGDGGSGSSGGDGGSPSYDFDPTVVDVERTGDGSVSVDADDVEAGENVTVDLPAGNDTAVSFGELVLDFDERDSFTLDARTSVAAPNGTTAPAANTTGFEPVGYLTVETADLDADAFNGSTVSFALDGERLADENATPADVSLYRWENGSWTPVDATATAWNASGNVSANATYDFAADLDEFSTFAVGVDRPAVSVTNVTVHERGLHVGDTAEFTAVVRNDGRANGTANVSFRMGDTVRNRTVDVSANATSRLTFVKRLATPGERTISVGDQSVYLWVEPQRTTTTTATDTTSTTADTTDTTDTTSTTATSPTASAGQPGFGIAVALVSLLAAALLARRRS